jgi:hypothetical protein
MRLWRISTHRVFLLKFIVPVFVEAFVSNPFHHHVHHHHASTLLARDIKVNDQDPNGTPPPESTFAEEYQNGALPKNAFPTYGEINVNFQNSMEASGPVEDDESIIENEELLLLLTMNQEPQQDPDEEQKEVPDPDDGNDDEDVMKMRSWEQRAGNQQKLREAKATIAAAAAAVFPSGKAFAVLEKTSTKTRFILDRKYVQVKPFQLKNLYAPPTVNDLSPTFNPAQWQDRFWFTIPCQILTFSIGYFSFPVLIAALDRLVTMEPSDLDNVTEKLWPGVSILYGTLRIARYVFG